MTRFDCPVELRSGDGSSAEAGQALRGPGLGPGAVLVLVDPACATLGLHDAAVPDAVAGFVRRLAPDLSLASLGVPEADLPALADAVAADDQTHFDRARAPDRDAALAILKGAFSA